MGRNTAVSIGTFDGVHIGHVALLRELSRQAEERGLPRWLLTFVPPSPLPAAQPFARTLLLPLDVRLRLLRPFAEQIETVTLSTVQSLSPACFAEAVLAGTLKAHVVVEGESFRFGCDRSGDTAVLYELGASFGFDVVTVPPVLVDGSPVSSTRIRRALQQGDLALAHRCLGRPPLIVGTVASGDRIGTSLGYPTANLTVDASIVLPPSGVYVVHAWGSGIEEDGVLYVGSRPTLGVGGQLRCEVHLLTELDVTLYGQTLELHILERVREDRAFASLSALQAQIQADIRTARALLAAYPHGRRRIIG